MGKKGKSSYDDMIFCSFCGRLREEVNKMIEGPESIYICDDCVEMCHKIMHNQEVPLTGDDVSSKNKELVEGKIYLHQKK